MLVSDCSSMKPRTWMLIMVKILTTDGHSILQSKNRHNIVLRVICTFPTISNQALKLTILLERCERALREGSRETEELWCRFIPNKSAPYIVREQREEQQTNVWTEQRRAVTPEREMVFCVDVDPL
jgi:hypothetical protein